MYKFIKGDIIVPLEETNNEYIITNARNKCMCKVINVINDSGEDDIEIKCESFGEKFGHFGDYLYDYIGNTYIVSSNLFHLHSRSNGIKIKISTSEILMLLEG